MTVRELNCGRRERDSKLLANLFNPLRPLGRAYGLDAGRDGGALGRCRVALVPGRRGGQGA